LEKIKPFLEMRKIILILILGLSQEFAVNFVYVIKIEGSINLATVEYISSSI